MTSKSRQRWNVNRIVDDRINAAFNASCTRIPINVMDISKVFNKGRELIADGCDDLTLQSELRIFVDTISKK